MKQVPGEGEGKEGNASRQALAFENLRLPANGEPDWLGQSNDIDMCQAPYFEILLDSIKDNLELRNTLQCSHQSMITISAVVCREVMYVMQQAY